MLLFLFLVSFCCILTSSSCIQPRHYSYAVLCTKRSQLPKCIGGATPKLHAKLLVRNAPSKWPLQTLSIIFPKGVDRLQLFWVDTKNKEHDYGIRQSIHSASDGPDGVGKVSFETYASHVWRVRDIETGALQLELSPDSILPIVDKSLQQQIASVMGILLQHDVLRYYKKKLEFHLPITKLGNLCNKIKLAKNTTSTTRITSKMSVRDKLMELKRQRRSSFLQSSRNMQHKSNTHTHTHNRLLGQTGLFIKDNPYSSSAYSFNSNEASKHCRSNLQMTSESTLYTAAILVAEDDGLDNIPMSDIDILMGPVIKTVTPTDRKNLYITRTITLRIQPTPLTIIAPNIVSCGVDGVAALRSYRAALILYDLEWLDTVYVKMTQPLSYLHRFQQIPTACIHAVVEWMNQNIVKHHNRHHNSWGFAHDEVNPINLREAWSHSILYNLMGPSAGIQQAYSNLAVPKNNYYIDKSKWQLMYEANKVGVSSWTGSAQHIFSHYGNLRGLGKHLQERRIHDKQTCNNDTLSPPMLTVALRIDTPSAHYLNQINPDILCGSGHRKCNRADLKQLHVGDQDKSVPSNNWRSREEPGDNSGLGMKGYKMLRAKMAKSWEDAVIWQPPESARPGMNPNRQSSAGTVIRIERQKHWDSLREDRETEELEPVENYSIEELKEELTYMHLSTEGTRAALMQRLREADDIEDDEIDDHVALTPRLSNHETSKPVPWTTRDRKKRFVIDDLLNPEECQLLIHAAERHTLSGSSYSGTQQDEMAKNQVSSANIMSMLLKSEISNAEEEAAAVLLLNVISRVQASILQYFNLTSLHISNSQVTARLPGGIGHATHSDDCIWRHEHQICEPANKVHECCVNYHYSAILFLTDQDDGQEELWQGSRFFWHEKMGEEASLIDVEQWPYPRRTRVNNKCGRLVGFSAGEENPHGVESISLGKQAIKGKKFEVRPAGMTMNANEEDGEEEEEEEMCKQRDLQPEWSAHARWALTSWFTTDSRFLLFNDTERRKELDIEETLVDRKTFERWLTTGHW